MPGTLRVFLPAGQIQNRIREIGAQIAADYPNGNIYLIGILKGACIFLSDLCRAIPVNARIEFIGTASYGRGKTSSGEVKLTKDLDVSIEGQDVIIVEDIVDSGVTLTYLMQVLRQRKPRSIRIASYWINPSGGSARSRSRMLGSRSRMSSWSVTAWTTPRITAT